MHKPANNESAFSLAEDTLTDDEWDQVQELIKLLKPFEKLTKLLQANTTLAGSEGSYGSLWEVLPGLQLLFEHLQDAEASATNDDIKQGIQFGLEKMNDYWMKLIFYNNHYIASTALHPSLNTAWFDWHWHKYPS